jgi:hypothetical protein
MSQAHRRRYVAIVIVGAVHILILEMLIHTRGAQQGVDEDTALWSTLIFIPAEVVQRPPPIKVRSTSPSAIQPPQLPLAAPATASPITAAPSPTSSAPRASVDWMSELHSAAAEVNLDRAGQGRATDEAPSKPQSLWAQPLHHAGEQYTLETGESVVWVSDRCFLVSEPPTLGTPNAFAHLALTHAQCTGSPGRRSDLFKDLPEYKKLHPQE